MHATLFQKIDNRTYLRKMHVPAAMAKLLQVCFACEGLVEECAPDGMSKSSGQSAPEPLFLSARYKKNQLVQQCALHVKDDEERLWPVTYEVRISSGQRHRSFTKGWAALCKGNGFGTGDKFAITITTCEDRDGERGMGAGRSFAILIRRVDQEVLPEG